MSVGVVGLNNLIEIRKQVFVTTHNKSKRVSLSPIQYEIRHNLLLADYKHALFYIQRDKKTFADVVI